MDIESNEANCYMVYRHMVTIGYLKTDEKIKNGINRSSFYNKYNTIIASKQLIVKHLMKRGCFSYMCTDSGREEYIYRLVR